MLKFNNLVENFEYPEVKTIEFKNEEILIKQYLSSEGKYGIIYYLLMALDLQNKPLSPLVAKIMFDLQIVKEYSNINFEDNIHSYFKEYDVLQINGLIDLIVENIPVEEYEELQNLYYEAIELETAYYGNFAFGMKTILNDMPNLEKQLEGLDVETLEKGQEIIKQLSQEQHI